MLDTLSKLLQAAGILAVVCIAAWCLVFTGTKCARLIEGIRHEWTMDKLDESHKRAEARLLWAQVQAAAPMVKAGPDETQEGIRRKLWITRLTLFFEAGDALGFSVRTMVKANVISWRGWILVTNHLSACNVLSVLLTGTRWQAGYNLDRALAELNAGEMPLPQWDAPDVNWASNAQRKKRDLTLVTQ